MDRMTNVYDPDTEDTDDELEGGALTYAAGLLVLAGLALVDRLRRRGR